MNFNSTPPNTSTPPTGSSSSVFASIGFGGAAAQNSGSQSVFGTSLSSSSLGFTFGGAAPGSSPFGQQQQPQTGNVFGSSALGSSSLSPSTSVFGSTGGVKSVFGSVPAKAQSSSVFGQISTASPASTTPPGSILAAGGFKAATSFTPTNLSPFADAASSSFAKPSQITGPQTIPQGSQKQPTLQKQNKRAGDDAKGQQKRNQKKPEAPPVTTPAAPLDDRAARFTNSSAASVIREKMKAERDAREKSYFDNYKPKKLSEARDVVGICQDMCPEFERYDREVSQELAVFEMLAGTEKDPLPKVDHVLAVKKYRRSAAGQDPEIFPEDIRPPSVLKVGFTLHNVSVELLVVRSARWII
jgi:hypothetical protein